jgi:pimeloyl-ACP methyl ester carboxylesterase
MKRALLVLLACLALAGCNLLDVRSQQEQIDAICILSGSVATSRTAQQPIVVVLFRQDAGAPRGWSVADHFVLAQPGRWGFGAGPGRYAVAAFEDRSRDLVYQPGETYGLLAFDRPLECAPGARLRDLALTIPEKVAEPFPQALDIPKLQARSAEGQLQATLGRMTATGEVASLSDARFGADKAEDGLWRPFDFLVESRAGVYFLEPYDPARIPVLFVHGINGTPANFEYLIGRLDRSRYQAWVYYYPSGVHLASIADHLDQTMAKLQLRHRVQRFAVVAHSMGGLVSRGFILRHARNVPASRVPLFVSISSPWGGHKTAALGVKASPVVVRVWEDMAPGSAYQRSLFAEPLPSAMHHHLVFTYADETVSMASQLLPQAQRETVKMYGFEETHMGVLRNPQVSDLVNRLLGAAL